MSKRRKRQLGTQEHQNGRLSKKARARAARMRAEEASQQRAAERRRRRLYDDEMNRRLAKS
ncbi:MAG: hypothetical protein PHO92_01645 [Candidatus Peribacteraceae bacterium]|nr:hypothetical protein [Candidatus Peribacteraceae bacterium]